MASAHAGVIPTKLSFAKVAAMNVPAASPSTNNLSDDKKAKAQSPERSARRKTMSNAKAAPPQAPHTLAKHAPPHADLAVKSTADADLAVKSTAGAGFPAKSTAGADLVGQATAHAPPAHALPSPVVNGNKSGRSGDSGEDDQSHLSSSSTKQHSFETKSTASVTTFAMDEKESIRPDDSASVRAVDEEDADSTLSRNAPFSAEPDQMPTPAVRRFHTLANPPRFGTLEEPGSDQAEESETTSSIEPAEGHDLLDALASPKDRLALLQLEQKLVEFISQSAIDYMDLPPQHSYARLLAHKLADYYGLLHVMNDGTSIRLFRATGLVVTLPTSLETLAKSIPTGSSQSLGLTAVKIMRRAGLPRQFSAAESTAPSSSAPSKATSEAGHSEEGPTSPTEAGTPSRDRSKMTREEREAQYKAARERIFGNMDELAIGESQSTGENSASLSRSSSSSGKKKTRKHRAPKDDSFDSRSAFVPGYGGMHVQQTPAYQPYAHNDMMYSSTPTQAYPGLEHQMQFHPSGACGHGQNPACPSPDGWSAMPSPSAGAAFFNNYPPQHTSGYGGPNMTSMMQQMAPFGPNTRTAMMPQYVQAGQANVVDANYARPSQSSLFNPQTKTESCQSSVGKSQASSTTSLHSSRLQDGGSLLAGAARPSSHDSLQQKYGKPANLPKKPPAPSQASAHLEAGSVQAVRRESGNARYCTSQQDKGTRIRQQ
ncbi:hypothetical protein DV737_g252, partial [Chaetothyriales sp. CBS 132003]